jgi:hypothetical protein
MTFARSMALAASGSLPIKASPTDTTPAELFAKLAAGAGMTLTLLNPGANEQVELAAAGSAGDLPFTAPILTGGIHAATPEMTNLVFYSGVTLTLPAYPNENDRIAVWSIAPVTLDGGAVTILDPFANNSSSTIIIGPQAALWYAEFKYTTAPYPLWVPVARGSNLGQMKWSLQGTTQPNIAAYLDIRGAGADANQCGNGLLINFPMRGFPPTTSTVASGVAAVTPNQSQVFNCSCGGACTLTFPASPVINDMVGGGNRQGSGFGINGNGNAVWTNSFSSPCGIGNISGPGPFVWRFDGTNWELVQS